MLTSTAYYPQTDGQSEQTIRTVEITLRYYFSKPDNNWVEALPFIIAIINNSVNFTTGFAPNELLGFKMNDNLNLVEDLPAEGFDRLRNINRDAAHETIANFDITAPTLLDVRVKKTSRDSHV